jgi:2-polyprenyl-3-methyl-5-hydroxy-6-metoxy-1,4-benzoquinol methylase
LGALKKERKKRKKRGQMSHSEIKRDLAAQVLLKVFKFLREVYEKFLKGAKYSPSSSLYPFITTSTLFSIHPFTTIYHTAHTHAYLDLTL